MSKAEKFSEWGAYEPDGVGRFGRQFKCPTNDNTRDFQPFEGGWDYVLPMWKEVSRNFVQQNIETVKYNSNLGSVYSVHVYLRAFHPEDTAEVFRTVERPIVDANQVPIRYHAVAYQPWKGVLYPGGSEPWNDEADHAQSWSIGEKTHTMPTGEGLTTDVQRIGAFVSDCVELNKDGTVAAGGKEHIRWQDAQTAIYNFWRRYPLLLDGAASSKCGFFECYKP